MRHALLFGSGLLLAAAPATAEVKSATENGFEIESRLESRVPPGDLYRAFLALPRWWSKDHSYSGIAANLSFEPRVGGCWCEKLKGGGGVEHMRVVHVDPGAQLVMTGSLGPLRNEATTGVMHVTFAPSATGSTLVLSYRVAGFARGGAAKLAPLVDRVLGIQLTRLDAFVAEGRSRR